METKTCLKCGHQWIPRMDDPKMCPKCKTYNWSKKNDQPK